MCAALFFVEIIPALIRDSQISHFSSYDNFSSHNSIKMILLRFFIPISQIFYLFFIFFITFSQYMILGSNF